MISPHVRRRAALAVAVFALAGAAQAADSKASSTKSSSATRSGSGSARGTLPDPVLLDGSTLPAEKKSEYGMIGDFELPGDENARTDRVGGPQQKGTGGPGVSAGIGLPGLPQGGLPSVGAGVGLPGLPSISTGGGAAGGATPPDGKAGGASGTGDVGAKAEGMQVGKIVGQGDAAGDAGQAGREKPASIAIGDTAMRIPQSSQAAAGTVGQQPVTTTTQQYEKGTGTGGKTPTTAPGSNKAEKGQRMPAGL